MAIAKGLKCLKFSKRVGVSQLTQELSRRFPTAIPGVDLYVTARHTSDTAQGYSAGDLEVIVPEWADEKIVLDAVNLHIAPTDKSNSI